MEEMGGAAGGGREGVTLEGGAPQAVCRSVPIKRSRGKDVNLQYSIRINSD